MQDEMQTMLEGLLALSQSDSGREILCRANAPATLTSWLPSMAAEPHQGASQAAASYGSQHEPGALPTATDSEEDDGMPRVASSSQWRAELERDMADPCMQSPSQHTAQQSQQSQQEQAAAQASHNLRTAESARLRLGLLLRVVRNMCAAGKAAGQPLVAAGLPAQLCAIVKAHPDDEPGKKGCSCPLESVSCHPECIALEKLGQRAACGCETAG